MSTPDIYRPSPILVPTSTAFSEKTSTAVPSAGNHIYNSDCTVYVSELDKATAEHDLYNFFAQIGPVQSVKIVKDQFSKRPLGYAYVNFQQQDHAKAALALDLKLIRGKPCRVKPFQKGPTNTHHMKTKIFVSNLLSSITDKELTELFSPYGTIVSCFIPIDVTKNKPRGFAHIQYDTPESAEKAIDALNGREFQGNKLYVKHHFSKYDKAANIVEHKANFTNIYIKNIDRQVTEYQFRELFEKQGTIVSLSLPLDDENLSRGFGFVNYETHDQAVAAVSALHNFELNGKHLHVCRTQKKYEREEELRQTYEAGRNQYIAKYASTNLYIKNLDKSVDQDVLYKEFSPFGHITSAKIMTGDDGVSKGFGFVCYSNSDEAQQAINNKNDTELMGQIISVSLAKRRQSSTSALSRDEEYQNDLHHHAHYQGNSRSKDSTASLSKLASSITTPTAQCDAEDEEELKQIMGKRLYDEIQVHPAVKGDLDLTAKLTGMILGLGSTEYSKWIDDKFSLAAHIQQAYDQYMQFLEDTTAQEAVVGANSS
ncbi:hypothetical protein D0Z03_001947 [Geotrichum reessii]|nr:hypothetical protein D0Z03_001947 [Galactomyces reessii]